MTTHDNPRHARHCICCQSERLLHSPAILAPFIAKRIFNHEPVEITGDWGLRDVKKGMAYSLCNSLACENCGAIFLDYRFSNDELARLYRDYRGEEYTAMRSRFEPTYAAISFQYQERANYISKVEDVLKSYLPDAPDVLDWGGDSGVNSPFRYLAKQLYVYDISGVTVCKEAIKLSQADCAIHRYDLVTCVQVLEHVSYPAEVLREIVAILRPETILYLEVPLEEIFRVQADPLTRLQKKRHWHEHINFFSPDSLKHLARRCGLKVLAANEFPIQLGWKDSAIQMVICKLQTPDDNG